MHLNTPMYSSRPQSGRPVRSSLRNVARVLSMAALAVAAPVVSSAQATLKLLYTINAFAGTGTAGETGGPQATLYNLSTPSGLGFDGQGNVYISDYNGNVVHKVNNLGVISTVAGTGAACANATAANGCGDGGLATAAQLTRPYVIAVDPAGNIFIADQVDNKIREVVAATGNITTLVGTGTGTTFTSTTPQTGTTTAIYSPDGIAVDANDNVYFSDSSHGYVYKYFANNAALNGANAGKVEVLAGTGNNLSPNYVAGQDGGQSNAAAISNPIGLAVDAAGSLYIADQGNNRIRRVTTAGIISTVAGNGTAGYAGDGGTAANAEFNAPRSVAIDNAGDLIVSDSQNLVIRIIYAAAGGVVSGTSYIETLAGSGAACAGGAATCGDGGLAIDGTFTPNAGGNGGSTQFGYNAALGKFFVADLAANRVRSLTLSTTFPATPVRSTTNQQLGIQLVGGAATISSITIAPGANGVQEFAVGAVTGQPANTYEGTPALTCSTNGTTSNAPGTICNIAIAFSPEYPGLRTAQLKVVTSAGTFYYGVSGNGTAPLATLKNANIATIAGTGVSGDTASGTATTSQIALPWGTAIDSQGNLYFADEGNNLVRKVTPAGVISTIAGGAATVCAGGTAIGDGCAPTQATLNGPRAVALDPAGDIFIADTQNERIREISVQTGLISTIAGGGGGGTANGILATNATFFSPSDIAFDSSQNLYIADSGDSLIKIISSGSQYILNYAGGGAACGTTAACGDGGQATAATLGTPNGIALDPQDNLLIADTGNNRIRLVTKTTGVISTVAGTGTASYTGDGGAATSATLNQPTRIATDAAGDYYISDYGNNALRQVLNGATTKLISTFAGNGTACAASPACGDGAAANAANISGPLGVSLDGAGNVYIADSGDNEVRKINVGAAALAFNTTPIGTTSADSPRTAYLQNIGNMTLTLSQPTSGTNASISPGYTQGNTQTCPQLTNGTGTLTAGTQCSYVLSFTPVAVGADNGSLIEMDNSLNATGSTQTVTLTGIGTKGGGPNTDTLTSSNLTPTVGTSVTLTDTIPELDGICPTGPATFQYTVAGGNPVVLSSNAPITQGAGATCVATLATTALPVGTDVVQATFPTDTNYLASSSNTLNEVVGTVASTNDTLTANPNTNVPYGTSVVLTFTVPPAANAPAPTGTVTFKNGTTVLGTGNVNAQGIATLSTTALPVGTDTVTAVYPGDANYAAGSPTATVMVVAATPAAVLTANPATGDTFGSSVTLTDTLQPINGVCPTGTVTFTNGTTTLGTGTVTPIPATGTPTSCVATTTTTALPVGNDTITATLPANGSFATSTATLPYTVGAAPSTGDTLTATPNTNVAFGTSVTLTFKVPVVNGVAPTGTVTFKNGTTVLGTGNVNAQGVATLSTTALPLGTDTVTAVYPGDNNYAAGSPTATVMVVAATPAAVLTANPATGDTFGSPVTLTDTLQPINGVCPTGTVTFTNGTTTLGTGTVTPVPATGTPTSCVATTTTTALPVGNDTITATLPANGSFATSTATLPYTVGAAPSTGDTLTATPNTNVAFGTSVTLTFTVPVVNGVAPTGTVTFKNGTTVLGTGNVNAQGIATLSTTALPVGTDTVTAVYPGDNNYAAGSPTATVMVVAATPAAVLTANPATGDTFGSSVTLTDTLQPINGVCPTGTVTFTNGTTTLGTGTVTPVPATGTPTSCVATTTTTALPVGNDTITATLPANGSFATSTATLPYTVGAAPSTGDTLTATPNTNVAFGTSVTLTFTVPVVNGVAPTGTVTFKNGTTVLGTGNVNAQGIATLSTTALPVGTDTVTAVYPGDANYAAGSPTATVMVVAATPTAVLTANPATGDTFGSSVTLTDTLQPINGVCPTGTVTFTNGTTTLGTGTVTPVPATGTPTSCVATTTTTALPEGNDTITATLPANGSFATSTATLPYTVGAAPSTGDTLTATPNTNVAFGTSVTLTFTVPVVNGVAPTGTVTFKNGTTVLGTGNVNAQGIATLSTTALPLGTDTVTAVYPGDNNYAAGSPTATVMVVAAQATASLSATPATGDVYGSSVTLTETITPINGICPVGTVTFSNGTTTLGTGTINAVPSTGTPTSCVATTTTSALPAGNDTITAAYPGSGAFAPITSTLPYTVAKGGGPLSDTLTSSNLNPNFGQSITLTDTIPELNGICPVGPATFTSNGAVLTSTAPITQGAGATCVATYTTAALPTGSDTVQASFPTDSNYAASTSNSLVENVGVTGPTGALTASPATGDTFGSPVTLTETIMPINGVCPTGTITFASGTTALGTGTINAVPATGTPTSCVATTTTSALPEGNDTITATYPGGGSFGGLVSTLPYTVGAAPSTGDTLTATPNTNVAFGTSVTLTFTVPVVNGVAPTGTVTFKNGTTVLGTGNVNAQGIATLSTTALPVGTDTVTAVYPGDANYAAGSPTATVMVVAASTGATLTASPATGDTFGSPVILTETITPVNGICPTGTVTFSNGTTALGTGTINAVPATGTPTSCVATTTTSALPVGNDTITATYPGGGSFSPISSTLPYTVGAAPSTGDTLTATPNTNVAFGTSVTLTFTVPVVNGVAPTGTVTFKNGTTVLGTGNVNAQGIATLSTTALPVGTDTVTAVYPGDANYAAGSPTATVMVVAASTGATLTASPATGDTFGSPVILTETITPVNGICPTGTVTFSNGTTALGTGTINAVPATGTPTSCVATTTTSALPVGNDTITATYPGGGSFSPISSTLPYTVSAAPSTGDTLTATPNTNVAFGTSVTLTFTVPVVNGVAPTGTVTFKNGTTVLGTGNVNAQGIATLSTTALPVGTDTVTAVYPGDANYAAGSPTATVMVVAASTGATLTASPATGDTFGSPVILTETITPVNGICPTGTVTFSNGTTALGTGTINAVPATGTPTSCVATTTTSALPVGNDTITATYPGGGSFSPISSTLPYTVSAAPSTGDTLTATPNTNVAFGTSVTLTFTVPVVNGVAPTGTVTFKNGTTVLGTGNVNAQGIATLSTTALPVGTDTVTAVYPGDANYAAGSPTATVMVVAASTGATLTASPATGDTFGSPVILTETITPVNGICPTGTVTFSNGTTALGTGTINAVPATGTPTSCVATTTTSALPVGNDTITATYPGGGSFSPISSTLPYTVSAAPSTGDTLTATPNTNVAFGTSVTLTFTVPVVNGVAPTGTVTFKNGTTVLGTGNVNAQGIATLSTTALPVGTDTVTAVYPGDANYAAGSPTATVMVVAASTGATLTASPATGDTFGSPVILTETITPVNGICPTGTVTFSNGTTALGTGTINAVPATGTPTSCVATTTTSALPVGNDTITATYPGGGSFSPISSTLPYTVSAAPSTGDTLTANPTTSTFGTSVVLTFTIPTVPGATASPTGTVTFTNGTTVLGTATLNTTAAGTTATITTSVLPVGTDMVTATYAGDTNYAAGAPTAIEKVTTAATTPTLTVSNPNPTFGQPITLTDTIPEVNGVCPAGPVSFTNNGVIIGTGTIAPATPATNPPTCVATITVSTLPAGTDPLQATFPPDNNYSGEPSNIVPVTVAPATPPATITVSPNPAQPNQPVTITETIQPVNGTCPVGTVTFNSGTSILGTGTITTVTTNGIVTCVATITVPSLPAGTTTITGTYPGGGNFGPIKAGPVTITINDFTIVGLTTNTINPGDTTTFPINLGGLNGPFNSTVTLAVTAGLPPGAIASFSPAALVPGAGPTLSTLTITTLATQARMETMHGLRDISYGLLLLPLLGFRRVRRKLRSLPKAVLYPIIGFALLGAVGSLTGCAGGYFGEAPHQYVITVTGTSGSLQHSTTVTLIVQ